MKHDEITLQSLRFKTKTGKSFPALSDYKVTLTHENIGRVNLQTPHTSPASLHYEQPRTVRANNLHNILTLIWVGANFTARYWFSLNISEMLKAVTLEFCSIQ